MTDHERAARWGIQVAYEDALGQRREVPDASVDHVVATLDRGEGRDGPAHDEGPIFVPVGRTELPDRVRGRALVLEDGTDVGPVRELPGDLPAGLHHLVADGDRTLLVVHPDACWRPDDLRMWGWALQLHADRSAAS